MISPEGLAHLNREVAVDAAARNVQPVLLGLDDWTAATEEIIRGSVPEWFRKMPFIGDIDGWRDACIADGKEPDEFEVVDELFHDITGHNLSDAGGPALSILGLAKSCERLCEEHGSLYFAITSGYQFQAYTTVMRKVSR